MRARKATAAALTVTFGLTVLVGVATAATGSYTDGPLSATFSASTTRPNCKQKWPVTVTARFHGKSAHATAYYQFLSGGKVVGTQQAFAATPKNPHSRLYHFYGSFYDYTFGPFGALSVGHPLTVRAVVQVGSYTAYPGLNVKVVSARGCPAK
jgi:hypothetical protein